MSLRDLLTVTDATVLRETISEDGMGGIIATTSSVSIVLSAIWSAAGSFNRRFLSDKLAMVCSHILVTEPALYSWSSADKYVTSGGKRFTIMGMADDVMGYGEILVIGLELQV